MTVEWRVFKLRIYLPNLAPIQRVDRLQGLSNHMPLSPMPESVSNAAHLQPGIPLDAAADAEAMWQLSNQLNSLQLQQAQFSGLQFRTNLHMY